MATPTFAPGTRVRHELRVVGGTVDPDAMNASTRDDYPDLVPVRWDDGDETLTAARFLRVEGALTHRPAVAAVPDVVFAENGATAIAPPPQARRGFSQAGLASVIQPEVAAGLHRAHTAEHAARALAAYVRAVELGQDINSHYEAAVAAAHAWTEATS
ncbi:hypothetical protein [Cellulosimicrobium protaetiae]